MEIPKISLRRNPTFAMIGLLAGLVMVVIGAVLSQFILVFPGVLLVLLNALLSLNPVAIVSNKSVEIRSVFGNSIAKYDHDGFHLLSIQNGSLNIQKGDRKAAINRISVNKIQGGDWRALESAIEDAKAAFSNSKR